MKSSRRPPAFPRDSDSDGVVDDSDQCSTDRGVAPTGCPDGDGDGIVDKDDRCSSTAGNASAAGCPDADGDGVVDSSDSCARLAGPAPAGCPPKQRHATAVALRRIGRRFVGRVSSPGQGCASRRRVVLRRVGSGKRSFGSTIALADGSFTIAVRRRLRGRFYVVVAERGNKTKLCRTATSRRVRR